MDGEDAFDRAMSDFLGPGIDRDWLADARSVSAEMQERYRLPLLDDAALTELAGGLSGIELGSRPALQDTPLDKTHEQNALQEVARLAGRLRELLEVDTPFGRRFLAAAERAAVANENVRRYVTRRTSPIPMPKSPVPSLKANLTFVEIVAKLESDRLKEAPQRRRGLGRKTEVLGGDLPALYAEIYPGAPIGSKNAYTGQIDGPRHRFVQMCAAFLGYRDETMANIEKAARAVSKKASEARD